jgi:hypothetical protein
LQESKIRVLLLHACYTDQLSYYDDWIDAFDAHRSFKSIVMDISLRGGRRRLRRRLHEVDAVIMLHSVTADSTEYIERHTAALADRKVPLLSFVGNELNHPNWPIHRKRDVLQAIRPDWIATQLLHEAGTYLFGDLALRQIVSIPHALNPAVFRPLRAREERPLDIGVRCQPYPPHIGDNDRNRLIEIFRRLGQSGRLTVDLSNERYNRHGWAEFLNRCRGTVSTEAGSWFLERDDSTVMAIRSYIRNRGAGSIVVRGDSILGRIGSKLPWALRKPLRKMMSHGVLMHESVLTEQSDFPSIHERFFAGRPRPPVYGKCISSRHFDAIGTRTCQIMFPGRFNDILEADRHYLALKPDASNLDEVLRRLRDNSEYETIVGEAYALVMENHTYSHRIDQIDRLLRQ